MKRKRLAPLSAFPLFRHVRHECLGKPQTTRTPQGRGLYPQGRRKKEEEKHYFIPRALKGEALVKIITHLNPIFCVTNFSKIAPNKNSRRKFQNSAIALFG
ncbi:hypothetical protein [Hyella patelloides]|uniref:hypothetical protein n=1 Tax=Hyella patelloides TaxID=1982969 RepID=UPI00119F0E23|nr:hypothetical protein [Hyella patelloides]